MAFYGIDAWRAWQKRPTIDNLKPFKRESDELAESEPYLVRTYRDMFKVVAFLNVMNKLDHLLFRGQGGRFPHLPTLLRDDFSAPGLGNIAIASDRSYYWRTLSHVCDRVVGVMLREGVPRYRPFRHYETLFAPIAPWAIVQHYMLWPTPLLDLTSSLRVAASFALGWRARDETSGVREGFVYVFGYQDIASDPMQAPPISQDVVTVRLSAMCPPAAARPHLQEGYLTGHARFDDTFLDRAIEPTSGHLIAQFHLVDEGAFFDVDFPQHTRQSLELPSRDERGDPRTDSALLYELDEALGLHIDGQRLALR